MTSFGGYQLDRVLGRGGMAEVWLAHKPGLGGFSKQVVVKRVLPHLSQDEAFMALFLKEARVAALFTHANLVRVFELGQHDGTYFIAMEYVRGCTLRALQRACFEKQVGLPLDVLARILTDACEGLHYAHELRDLKGRPLDLVHLDVSPENLLISFDGLTKVSDFGVARAREHSHSANVRGLFGKAVYMPPEQSSGQPIDRRADVYAVAAITFELVAGQLPIELRTGAVRTPEQFEAIDWSPIRDVAPSLEAVLRRGLASDPAQRPGTVRELASMLSEALAPPSSSEEVARVMAELVGQPPAVTLPEDTPRDAVSEATAIKSNPLDRTSKDPGSTLEDSAVTPQPVPDTQVLAVRPEAFAEVSVKRELVAPARRNTWWGPLALAVVLAAGGLGAYRFFSAPTGSVLVHAPAGVTVLIDGQPTEPERARRLDVGRHRLEAVDATGKSQGRWIEVADGERLELQVTAP